MSREIIDLSQNRITAFGEIEDGGQKFTVIQLEDGSFGIDLAAFGILNYAAGGQFTPAEGQFLDAAKLAIEGNLPQS